MRLLIAGCGDLGTRLGLRWIAAGGEVLAWRRQPEALPEAFERFAVDLSKPVPARAVDGEITAVAYAASADGRTPQAYKTAYVDGLERVLDVLPPTSPRLVFSSSTAVYGEEDGWVDESSITQPAAFNGEIMLEAEALLTDAPTATAARLSGLYGPGRDRMLRRALSGEIGSARWGNRIHIDDAAAALMHILRAPSAHPILCVSDDMPTQDAVVLARIREMHGLPAGDPPPSSKPPSGRRVSNRRLRESGFVLQYPDFMAGYRALAGVQTSGAALL